MTYYTYHPEENPLDYSERHGCWLNTIATAVVFGLLFALCIFLSSCASTKTVTQIEYRDSIRTEFVHDTCYMQIHDTTYVRIENTSESEEGTEIVFADGGSYNASTGQADNVQSVRTSKKEKEQARTIIQQASEIEAYKARNDSLRQALNLRSIMGEQQQNTADIKPKTSGWHRFLVWWFFATAGVLLCVAGWRIWKVYRHFTIGV